MWLKNIQFLLMSRVNDPTIPTVFKWANCYLVGFSNNVFKKHYCSVMLRDFINWNIACRILKLVQVNSTEKGQYTGFVGSCGKAEVSLEMLE